MIAVLGAEVGIKCKCGATGCPEACIFKTVYDTSNSSKTPIEYFEIPRNRFERRKTLAQKRRKK